MSTATSSTTPPVKWLPRAWAAWGRWRYSFRFWLSVVIGVIVVLLAYYVMADRFTPLTTDAYVQAYVVQVAPQVEGQVVRVLVKEGDTVKKGDLLFSLDPRPFEHRVALEKAKLVDAEYKIKQLEAQLDAAKADERQIAAETEYARAVHRQEEEIYKKQSTTERKYLDAVQKLKASEAALDKSASMKHDVEAALDAKVGSEHALVAQAKASLAESELDLEYTQVHAPCDGAITNLQLREGAYARRGEAVLTCIDNSQWTIVANMGERGLERMQIGDPALVGFQAMPGELWPAHITSLGSGVGQGQGVPSGMLPDVSNKRSWIPEGQRFQVRIELDEPADVEPRVGMTASVSVYIQRGGVLPAITRLVHRLVSWLYYL